MAKSVSTACAGMLTNTKGFPLLPRRKSPRGLFYVAVKGFPL